MSWLRFNRAMGRLDLYAGDGVGSYVNQLLGCWKAHNDVALSSNGIWPNGTYKWSHYNAHLEAGLAPGCMPTAYGCGGIHVFDVPGRSGMGVHGGRTQVLDTPGGKTLGCIRVAEEAMMALNSVHPSDPIQSIVVAAG
jgi:hypothetical protein